MQQIKEFPDGAFLFPFPCRFALAFLYFLNDIRLHDVELPHPREGSLCNKILLGYFSGRVLRPKRVGRRRFLRKREALRRSCLVLSKTRSRHATPCPFRLSSRRQDVNSKTIRIPPVHYTQPVPLV